MAARLILFDIDGTLAYTHGAGRAATRGAMLEVFGTEAGLAAHKFGGKTDLQTLVELLGPLGYSTETITAQMPAYTLVVERHMRAVIGEFTAQALPGSLALVEALHHRDDVLLGIVTGNVSRIAPLKLTAAGFQMDWFPVGAFGDEALDRNDLPPLALERAATHYQQTITPAQVIIVGDTPADVASARALGAVAVAVPTGFATREQLRASQPDVLLDDLTGFAAALDL
ncbi:MAG: HAD hydrolase-like protein [Chloroflexi bacterium]|nr:HAD hydrolase-like protein [Chloroflexota bacterium]